MNPALCCEINIGHTHWSLSLPTMASAGLREKLECSICLNFYTDPVTLRCGHNFCRVCIDQVLNTQDGYGVYSCPECREEFQEWPTLIKNITLCNVVENFLSTHQDEAVIFCTYCVDSPVPAVRSCLMCEASLCDKHLKVHSKGPEHVLTNPRTSLENRKCPIHKKILEYYCTEDASCICVSCSLAREHRGHPVVKLDEASEEKKKKLRNVLQKLITKREKTEERVQSLEERSRKAQEKSSGEAERVTALFIDIRRRLDDLEKRILSEISRQEEKMSRSLSDVIQKLEIKKNELSRKMRDIEELCNMTDPLTVLQDPDTGDLCDPEELGGDEDTGGHDGGDEDTGGHDGGDEDTGGHDGGDKDTGGHDGGDEDTGGHDGGGGDTGGHDGGDQSLELITHTLCDIIRGINVTFYVLDPVDLILDINTVYNKILISDDLKTATWTDTEQNRPETEERFQNYQVMSSGRFSSGRHYWDVEISGSGLWMVGMCYPGIDRRGDQSFIGYNNKSWGLRGGLWCNNKYSMIHDSEVILLPHQICSDRVRICLDYEAGRLSFYELCDPIRHLHTFTTTFTEPLHAVLNVDFCSIKISGGGAAVRKHHHRGNLPRDW
ncbi:E3 ubiquitin/ISG15 ligase TRIM25-like [Hyla sarda]|uniref:E3 ubiquitin/ISG15 ligase TRIM25-like n=1 Tax=Hyla sarda TaxID=327740 RepID=UPI0024C24C1B|nr:E3 ubiquitin/ISG15 ligase TRIM25-like [Hyla sarda]